MEAKRAAIVAAVVSARKEEAAKAAVKLPDAASCAEDAESKRAVQMEAKRAAVQAAVAAARKADVRKVTAMDLFGQELSRQQLDPSSIAPEVKDFRMQGNYGHTKFIKP